MRSISKFGAIVLLLVWISNPAMACLLPGARLTAEEKGCCKTMSGRCQEMGMPASHSCCQKTVKPSPIAFQTKVSGIRVNIFVAGGIENTPGVLPSRLGDKLMATQFHSPPHSPPTSLQVLRV